MFARANALDVAFLTLAGARPISIVSSNVSRNDLTLCPIFGLRRVVVIDENERGQHRVKRRGKIASAQQRCGDAPSARITGIYLLALGL